MILYTYLPYNYYLSIAVLVKSAQSITPSITTYTFSNDVDDGGEVISNELFKQINK